MNTGRGLAGDKDAATAVHTDGCRIYLGIAAVPYALGGAERDGNDQAAVSGGSLWPTIL